MVTVSNKDDEKKIYVRFIDDDKGGLNTSTTIKEGDPLDIKFTFSGLDDLLIKMLGSKTPFMEIKNARIDRIGKKTDDDKHEYFKLVFYKELTLKARWEED